MLNRDPIRGFGIVVLVILLLLMGCAQAGPAAPAPQETEVSATEAPAEAGPKPGGTFIIGLHQEPDRFWTPITGLTVAQETAILVDDVLIKLDDNVEYIPSLAVEVPTLENGGISEDGLKYTFKLRDDVRWHDGTPFTAQDVKFTIETILNPDVPIRGRVGWNKINAIQTPDDHTVILEFETVDAAFLDRVAQVGILPAHVLGDVPAEELANHEWFRAPNPGLGPFKFVEWVPGDHLTLERNPDYYIEGQPYLDRIIMKIIPDANTLLNQLETGEIDARVRMLNDGVPVVQQMPNVRLVSVPSTTPWVIWLNNTDPRLADKNVRQALQYGFDKDALLNKLLNGLVERADGLIPPSSWAYNPDIKRFNYDPEQARALLDAAGWVPGADGIREKDGKRLSFEIINIAGEQERVQILSFIANQWKDIGIEAKIKQVDVATMWGNMLPKRTYEMAYSYTGRLADPADLSDHYLCPEKNPTRNFAGYCNPEVDELLIAAGSTVDREKRAELYKKALAIVAEDAVYIFLGWRPNHTPLNKRVHGYKPAPAYLEWWNAAEIWVD